MHRQSQRLEGYELHFVEPFGELYIMNMTGDINTYVFNGVHHVLLIKIWE